MEQLARTLVVGDIHGKLSLLNRLLVEMRYEPEVDRLVLIGDLVDRGEDSRGVVERAIALKEVAPEKVTVLRGNHEQMMIEWIGDPEGPGAELWYFNGGIETLRSYMTGDGDFAMPRYHFDFLANLPTWHEDEHGIYVHAALPEAEDGRFLHPSEQPDSPELIWSRSAAFFNGYQGKTVVIGHTITGLFFGKREEVWIRDDLIGVDTGAFMSGVLSAVELPSRQVYRVREEVGGEVAVDEASEAPLGGLPSSRV